MSISILSILVNEDGQTIGAEVRDNATGRVSNLATTQLQGMSKLDEKPTNAIIDSNGFVRSNRRGVSLKKKVLVTKRSAVQQAEIMTSGKILSKDSVTVFHGSKDVNLVPRFGLGSKNNDYGRGFYTTPNKELAKEWAWAGYTEGDTAYVYEFVLSLKGLSVLNLTLIDSIHWIAELVANRRLNFGAMDDVIKDNIRALVQMYKIDTSKYDVIIGYRADDSYFKFAEAFARGALYKGTLDNALRFGGLGLQIFIKSEKAFNALRFVAKEEVPRHYEQRFNNRDLVAREQFNNARKRQLTQDMKTIYDFIKRGNNG